MATGDPVFQVSVLTSHQQTESEFLMLIDHLDSWNCDVEQAKRSLCDKLLQELSLAFQGHRICGRPCVSPESVHFMVRVRLQSEGRVS